jgi:putative tricarboxylic transport membrane protein
VALGSISRRHAELGFAAALVAAAGFFFHEAGDYPELSGTYPQVLSILLGIGGLLMIARTLVWRRPDDDEPIFDNPGRVYFGSLVLVAYIAAVSQVGYLIPSLVIGVALPAALGYRHLRRSALITLATLGFIVMVFVVGLQRPIPPDLLDPLLVVLR